MLNMPDVPNWLQWLATITTILVLLWGVLKYLWRRWLSDMWAKRSRDASMKKAENLVKQFREALHLADNDRRFQAISTMVISQLLKACIVLAIGAIIIMFIVNDFILLPERVDNWVFIVGAAFFWLGLVIASDALEDRQKFIKPYIDWVKYYESTLDRIGSLLCKAGLNEEEQAAFIDNVVSDVEKDIIEHEEFDIEND